MASTIYNHHMHKQFKLKAIFTVVLFIITLATSVGLHAESNNEYTTEFSKNKREISKLQKEVTRLEKELSKLKVTEQDLVNDEKLLVRKAWDEAGKRKKRKDTTTKNKKEIAVLNKLTAKRAELKAHRDYIAKIQSDVAHLNRELAVLHGADKIKAPTCVAVETKPKADVASAKNTSALHTEANSWLGTRYRYGGNTKNGVDCSGFTTQIYKSVYQINLPRTSSEQHKQAIRVKKKSLQAGDLVFFKIKKSKVNHVGIYLGNGQFIHASSSRGVVISKLSEAYYQKYFIGGGRYS